VTAVSVGGCTDVGVVQVVVQDGITLSASGPMEVCEGQDINLTAVSDGDSFIWTGPNGFVSVDQNPTITAATPAAAGDYTVIASRNGVCESTAIVTVQVTQAFIAEFNTTAETCNSFGNIFVGTFPAIANLTYDWADIPGSMNVKDRIGVSAGTYSVTITDPNGCSRVLDNIVVDLDCACSPAEVLGVNVVNSVCGLAEGQATILVAGNIADYSYTWTPNTGVANAVGNTQTGLAAGTYDVLISSIGVTGCDTTITFSVGNINGPTVDESCITWMSKHD